MGYTLGLVSISFRDCSHEAILAAMNKAGLSVIEWGSDVHVPPEKAEMVAALQKQYGISCCSYGTYFRLGVTPLQELPQYIAAAKTLGTTVVRLWCGDKNSEEYTAQEKKALFEECKAVAALAQQHGVVLCMECHEWTYTNTKESALELMQAVNADSFRLYWQPNQYRSAEENIAYATLLAPYTVHVHVFNWKGDEKYPLHEARDVWKQYLTCFDGDRVLLLEFMPDGKLESLTAEAAALKEIAE